MITAEDIFGGIDTEAVRSLVRGTYMGKYGVSLRHGAGEAIEWAKAFGLDTREPCKVLDIGCGIGTFAKACDVLGHDTTGIDQPGYMHAEVAKIMGIKFIEHKVTASNPLPSFEPETFGVVTTMHISNHEGKAFYQCLADVVWKALQPGGQWWIVFHFQSAHWMRWEQWGEWFNPGRITQRGSRVLLLEKPL